MSSPEESNALEQLCSLERVVVREKTADYPNCKYVVTSSDGVVLLYAKEDCGIVNKVLAGKTRTFQIDVFDTSDREVMKLRRPYSVGQDKMDVNVCGQLAAIVRKEVTFFKPVLTINDTHDRQVIRVKGPVSTTSQCDFELYSNEKKRIGAICKRWNGLTRSHGDRDNFVIHFPQMDASYKAAVLGTCFLIDFLYYEN
ncbi:phospholipid scramblase 1 [Pieris rapae]|uniref:phospholipid scramblase 1 n=1 Tax=Pieris rapae TaxID=64459 RepID=UPI001E27D3F8|nr:phospholipid scramblase 1 [Pieris rapae]XP_045488554.1 phospholipid scramblase 1 [Pieris rapae]XP_045488555.1 phospholipid scramblase 1 [Pieris rapae]XP_045488556.1 phospholipid scramblase 1 [Pieris rapae]